jgi:ATP-dependent Clp protease ATP-binding subunit ClpB
VAEPSIEDSIEILKGIAHYYEDYHQVTISDEMCAAGRHVLSERYITDRFLPDKAIDLIDEACSDVNLRERTRAARQEDVEKEIADLAKEQGSLCRTRERGALRAPCRDTLKSTIKLNGELDELKAAAARR